MSFTAMKWAFEQPLKGLQKSTLVTLAYHANDEGKCWPSISLLATECGMNRSSVIRHINALVELKLLSKEPRRDAKGYCRSSVYQLNMQQGLKSQRRENQRWNNDSLGLKLRLPKVSNCDGNIIEQSLELTKEPSSVFVVFDHWKKTLNHPKARFDKKRKSKIAQALKNYSPEDLCLAVDGCKASRWHMGDNADKRIHDSIDLIFRDTERIERFIAIQSQTGSDNALFAGAI